MEYIEKIEYDDHGAEMRVIYAVTRHYLKKSDMVVETRSARGELNSGAVTKSLCNLGEVDWSTANGTMCVAVSVDRDGRRYAVRRDIRGAAYYETEVEEDRTPTGGKFFDPEDVPIDILPDLRETR